MTTTKLPTKAEKTTAICELIETFRAGLERNAPGRYPLPTPEIIAQAVTGAITRRGALLRRAPSFDANPYASLLHRIITWHRSTGELTPVMMVRFDCKRLTDDDDQLFNALDNLARLMNGSNSPAVDRWHQALGDR
jgi:hypothetical protein